MFLVFLVYAILATTFVIGKVSLDYAHPFFLIGIRMTAAGFLLLTYLALFHRDSLKVKKEKWPTLFKISFFHIYLAFLCEFWGLQYTTSSKINLIYTSTPFIAATLSYFIFHEKLTRMKVLGLILGLVGLLPVILMRDQVELEVSMGNYIPELVIFVGVVSASYAWFDIKKLLNEGYSLIMINGSAMLIGGLGALLTTLVTLPQAFTSVTEPYALLKSVALMILVSNVVFYNLYGFLIKKYSITFIALAGFLSPIFGAYFGYLFLNEPITWHYGASLATVTLALYLFYKEELKTSPRSKQINEKLEG